MFIELAYGFNNSIAINGKLYSIYFYITSISYKYYVFYTYNVHVVHSSTQNAFGNLSTEQINSVISLSGNH